MSNRDEKGMSEPEDADTPYHAEESVDPGRALPRQTFQAINFVADAGKEMLESSSSVSEVIARLRRFLPAVGLEGCDLDATLSSLILSYTKPGQAVPITAMRVVEVADPRLERLAGAEDLLDRLERREIDLDEAREELRALSQAPRLATRYALPALMLSVAGWTLFIGGLDSYPVTVAVALLATVVAFPVDSLVRALRFPSFVTTGLAAAVIAAIPNLLAAAGVSVRVGPAVVGALFVYLPGRAITSSVIDGLANAPLSSLARGLQATVTAGALALGMLAGTQIGTGLGLEFTPDTTSVAVGVSLVGAVIGMAGLALSWAMPRANLPATLAIGSAGWVLFALLASRGDTSDWPWYLLAAGLLGLLAGVAAALQRSSASIYVSVAILPLVPGFTLYQGVLALAQGDEGEAGRQFGEAAVISLSIAIGLAVALAVAQNLIAARLALTKRSG